MLMMRGLRGLVFWCSNEERQDTKLQNHLDNRKRPNLEDCRTRTQHPSGTRMFTDRKALGSEANALALYHFFEPLKEHQQQLRRDVAVQYLSRQVGEADIL